MDEKIEGLVITPLKKIAVSGGDVLHALKVDDQGYKNFGEAYFSIIHNGVIKGWKRHNKMTLNIIVPIGEVKFVLYDKRSHSSTNGNFFEIILSFSNYKRLTIPPKIWFGFQGCAQGDSMLLNIANIEHDPSEVDQKDINQILYNWGE